VLAGGLYERTSGAAGQPLGSYQRRAPERTVLHELVARHAQSLLAELRDADPDGGGLPRYVERELAAYLRCGVLAHGFTRVRCQTCHDEIVVAFSCKRRGLCPSCTSRRMADTAAHLVDRILPLAPYRQWVFTVPKPLRLVLARDPAWTRWTGALVVRAIAAWQRRVARKRGLLAAATPWIPWAELLKQTFDIDALACPCGGRLRFIALVTEPSAIEPLLENLGLPTKRPVRARARAPTWFEVDAMPAYDT
jgi:hypothetical protein